MSKQTYSDRLKDPRWQKKRLEIFSRDNFACRFCSSDKKTLHVHHKYYEKGVEIWDYPDRAFLSLCEDCHKSEEIQLKENIELFIQSFRRSRFNASDLLVISNAIEYIQFNIPSIEMSDCILQTFISNELIDKMIRNKDLYMKEFEDSLL